MGSSGPDARLALTLKTADEGGGGWRHAVDAECVRERRLRRQAIKCRCEAAAKGLLPAPNGAGIYCGDLLRESKKGGAEGEDQGEVKLRRKTVTGVMKKTFTQVCFLNTTLHRPNSNQTNFNANFQRHSYVLKKTD